MSADREASDMLAALQRLLDSHGGDPARWPAGSQERFGDLLANDARARVLFNAARALERVLSTPAAADMGRQAILADRIIAALDAGGAADKDRVPAVAVSSPAVVDLAAARAARKPVVTAGSWRAAALLAASLVAGVFLGQAGGLTTTIGDVAALVGMAADADSLTVALDHAVDGSVDEEAL